MDGLTTGIEWVAATLAPWSVAPHPNFATATPSADSLLALVADLRSGDMTRYASQLENIEGWQRELVDAAVLTVSAETQLLGAAELSRIASVSATAGARAAAVIFATVAYSDQDQLDSAIRLLNWAIDTSRDSTLSWPEYPTSLAITRASLLVQRAMRRVEIEDTTGATVDSRDALVELAAIDRSQMEPFRVSPALGWDSYQVQEDLAAGLTHRANRILSRLAPIEDNSWVDLIRARPLWMDIRAERRAQGGLEAFVDDRFEETFHSTDQSVRWVNEDPVLGPVAASLFNAELSGHYDAVVERRSTFAKALLLVAYSKQIESGEELAFEAIRLLRRARDRKALENSLSALRSVGPIQALKGSGARVITLGGATGRVSRADLEVMSAAAELLTPSERRQGIRLTWRYMVLNDRTPQRAPYSSPDWPRIEAGWRAISDLLPTSEMDNEIAKLGVTTLARNIHDAFLVSPAMYRIISAIDWERVRPEVISEWTEWCRSNKAGDFHALAAEALEAVGLSSEAGRDSASLEGLELAENVVLELQAGRSTPDELLDRAAASCIIELDRIRRDAAQGRHSLGGRSAPQLAVILAVNYRRDRDDLWDTLIDTLADPNVSVADKGRGLSQLAAEGAALPSRVKDQIVEKWAGVAAARADSFSYEGQHRYRGALLRLGFAIGAVSSSEFMQRVSELATGDALDQIQALGCMAWSELTHEMRIWSITLGTQLSLGLDPNVRSNAAYLVGRQVAYRELLGMLVSRLTALLQEDGIDVPLYAIRGIRDGIERGGLVDATIVAVIDDLATSHEARTVREAATDVKSVIGSSAE